jgi:hypothetical protein
MFKLLLMKTPLAISPGLFSFQVRFSSQNTGYLVDDFMLWLSDRFRHIFPFPKFRRGHKHVYGLGGIVLVRVAFD